MYGALARVQGTGREMPIAVRTDRRVLDAFSNSANQFTIRGTGTLGGWAAARGPGTSVGFINCYSLRSSLRLPGRDSTLLHDSTSPTEAVARANRRSDRASRYDRGRAKVWQGDW